MAVLSLRGKDPRGREVTAEEKKKALAALKKLTGQDFGLDADKWEAWIKREMPQKW